MLLNWRNQLLTFFLSDFTTLSHASSVSLRAFPFFIELFPFKEQTLYFHCFICFPYIHRQLETAVLWIADSCWWSSQWE